MPESYLVLVGGTLYDLDTNKFRIDVITLLSDQYHIWMPDAFEHATLATIVGTDLARRIQLINNYSIEFEDGRYSVRLIGSNNNFFDVAGGFLVQNSVQVIPGNSAGLVQSSVSGLTREESEQLKLSSEIMTCDQFFNKETGVLHYYRRGTTEDIIPPKIVAGEQVTNDVSIEES